MSADHPADAFATLSIADGASAPADGLARALEGVQAFVRALGDEPGAGGKKAARRLRLRARPTAEGLALHLGAPQLALDLGLGDSPGEVAALAWRAWTAIAAGDDDALAAAVPDDARRGRARHAMRRALPKADEGWALVLAAPGRPALRLGAAQAAALRKGAPEVGPAVRMTVTGELAGADFGAARLTLRVGPAGRAIAGAYPPALEVKLLKLRRKAVHLTGDFALDAAGEPRALRMAVDVAPVDLAPLTFAALDTPAGRLAFEAPAAFEPALDAETGQHYVVSDPLLEIDVRATSRDELEAALRAELQARWARYARPDLKGREAALARLWQRRMAPAVERDEWLSGIT
jgi:hypothetical protein